MGAALAGKAVYAFCHSGSQERMVSVSTAEAPSKPKNPGYRPGLCNASALAGRSNRKRRSVKFCPIRPVKALAACSKARRYIDASCGAGGGGLEKKDSHISLACLACFRTRHNTLSELLNWPLTLAWTKSRKCCGSYIILQLYTAGPSQGSTRSSR